MTSKNEPALFSIPYSDAELWQVSQGAWTKFPMRVLSIAAKHHVLALHMALPRANKIRTFFVKHPVPKSTQAIRDCQISICLSYLFLLSGTYRTLPPS